MTAAFEAVETCWVCGGRAFRPMHEAIFELSAHERPSASDGERRDAESIAARLHALGWTAHIQRLGDTFLYGVAQRVSDGPKPRPVPGEEFESTKPLPPVDSSQPDQPSATEPSQPGQQPASPPPPADQPTEPGNAA